MKLLVAFVNNYCAQSLSLLALDLPTGDSAWLGEATADSADSAFFDSKGICGLLRLDDFWLVGFQKTRSIDESANAAAGGRPQIATLDARFQPVRSSVVEGLLDLHTFVRHEDKVLTVSTKTDEIFALEVAQDGSVAGSVWWRSKFAGEDVQHINSLGIYDGAMVATMFGHTNERDADGVRNGKVFEPRSGKVLLDGLHQPHTFTPLNGGGWVVAESARAQVIFDDGKRVAVPGYARGIVETGHRLLVGLSRSRVQSRSRGTMLRERTSQNNTLPAIAEIDLRDRSLVCVHSLAHLGSEIYDICIVPESDELPTLDSMRCLQHRVHAMDEDIVSLMVRLENIRPPRDVRSRLLSLGSSFVRRTPVIRSIRKAIKDR